MGDFRLIALCNIVYKVVAKVIENILKGILSKVISKDQSGFVARRSIVEGIIVVDETIHSTKKTREDCMILKLDILKAYDLVDKNFLIEVLEKFGFSSNQVNWIKSCISTPKFFVLVNGTIQGFFSSTRGIKHGDPLSPFLFIIMVQTLGISIN